METEKQDTYKVAWETERRLKWALARLLYTAARERDVLIAENRALHAQLAVCKAQ